MTKDIIAAVFRSRNLKRSLEERAGKIGISIEDYLKIKDQISEAVAEYNVEDDIENFVVNLILKGTALRPSFCEPEAEESSSRITSEEVNLEEDSKKIHAHASFHPRSAEEIIELLKIDTSIWSLKQYWNKEKTGSGKWEISALVAKKKQNEITTLDVEGILSRVFEDYPVPIPIRFEHVSNQKALFIYMSDKHIASYVNAHRAIYANEYGEAGFEQRMMRVLEEIRYLKDVYGTFEDIFLIDLGDKMDGWDALTTRGGHKLPQNMNNREAFETALRVEKKFCDELFQSDCANNYHLVQNACSNHGGDFDYLVFRAFEEYIKLAYPNVTTRVLNKFIEHITYGQHVFLLTHGKDDEDQKFGFPLHVNEKTENYITKYLMYHGIDPEQNTIHLIKGDLHQAASQLAYYFRYRNVLSIFGGSKWIGTNFGPNRPGCSYDIVEKGNARVFEGKVLFKQGSPSLSR